MSRSDDHLESQKRFLYNRRLSHFVWSGFFFDRRNRNANYYVAPVQNFLFFVSIVMLIGGIYTHNSHRNQSTAANMMNAMVVKAAISSCSPVRTPGAVSRQRTDANEEPAVGRSYRANPALHVAKKFIARISTANIADGFLKFHVDHCVSLLERK